MGNATRCARVNLRNRLIGRKCQRTWSQTVKSKCLWYPLKMMIYHVCGHPHDDDRLYTCLEPQRPHVNSHVRLCIHLHGLFHLESLHPKLGGDPILNLIPSSLIYGKAPSSLAARLWRGSRACRQSRDLGVEDHSMSRWGMTLFQFAYGFASEFGLSRWGPLNLFLGLEEPFLPPPFWDLPISITQTRNGPRCMYKSRSMKMLAKRTALELFPSGLSQDLPVWDLDLGLERPTCLDDNTLHGVANILHIHISTYFVRFLDY